MFGASTELASVMEFGFNSLAKLCYTTEIGVVILDGCIQLTAGLLCLVERVGGLDSCPSECAVIVGRLATNEIIL